MLQLVADELLGCDICIKYEFSRICLRYVYDANGSYEKSLFHHFGYIMSYYKQGGINTIQINKV